MRWRDWRLELLLCAGILAFNLTRLGYFGLTDVDEAIFAECTREMLVSGDYVTPRYNTDFRWDKPPLTYWGMSLTMRLFGTTPFGARAWSAAVGAAACLMLMVFGRLLFDRRSGLCAGALLAFCLHGFALSHFCIADMTLTALMAAGWLCLLVATETRRAGWFVAAGFALGLATLTKGPVAVVLPGFSWLVWLLWQRRGRLLAAPEFWLGPLACLLVIAPWCLAIYLRHGDAFFAEFIGKHNVARLKAPNSGHSGPIWTYLVIVAGGLLPWTGFVAAGLVDAWRRRADGAAGRAAMLLLLGAATVIGLFSFSGTKLPNYIAPAYPLLALLGGRVAAEASATPGRRPWGLLWFLNLGGLVLLGCGLLAAGWIIALPAVAGVIQRQVGASLELGGGPALAGAVILLGVVVPPLLWRRGRPTEAVIATAGLGAVAPLLVWLTAGPLLYRYQQGTVRVMGLIAARQTDSLDEFATLNVHLPSVPWTTHRFITRATADPADAGAAWYWRRRFESSRPLFLITRPSRIGDLLAFESCYDWGAREGWALFSNRPPPAGWRLPPSPRTEAEARALETWR